MRITVCITSYNQAQFLDQAIESVLAQTRSADQIVIVDDCSTDHTLDVLSGYAKLHPHLFTIVRHPKNLGVTQSRNDAFEAVHGDCVTFLDGDDYFFPEKLEQESLLLENSGADFVFSNFVYIDPGGRQTGIWLETPCSMVNENIFPKVFARAFPRRSLYRSELVWSQKWRQIGKYDPRINLYEDFDMRIRLSKNLRASYLHQPLSAYRIHSGGLSRVPMAKHVRTLSYIYEKNKHLLEDLPASDRMWINDTLMGWMALLIRNALRESISGKSSERLFGLIPEISKHAPLFLHALWTKLREGQPHA